jgi:hypothetical protein
MKHLSFSISYIPCPDVVVEWQLGDGSDREWEGLL